MDKLNKHTLSSQVAERVRQYIVDNDLKPGDRIPSETEFMSILGVSRSTIREAIKQVQVYGILDVKPGLGAKVKNFNLAEALNHASWGLHVMSDENSIKELWETRSLLEIAILPLVVERADSACFEKLIYHYENMQRAKSITERRRNDALFHKTLLESTGNRVLAQMGSIILDFFHKLQEFSPHHKTPPHITKQSLIDHKEICDFLKAKDLPRLKKIMKKHFQRYKIYLWDGPVQKK